jgi:hypothetical protein
MDTQMSTPLIIDETVRERIRQLVADAQAHPVDMSRLMTSIQTPSGKARHREQMTRQTIEIPLAFLVTFSIELGHPCCPPGETCRHMSMSVGRAGRIPNEHALWLIASEFGFWGSLKQCLTWPEQLLGHGCAINVVQPMHESRLHQ